MNPPGPAAHASCYPNSLPSDTNGSIIATDSLLDRHCGSGMGISDRFGSRFSSRSAGPVEPAPASVVNAAAADAFGTALAERGLEAIGPRKWGHPGARPIREVFELQALKGASYTPYWGFSFDFVPHLVGEGGIRWHRTLKSARVDLGCRPIDHETSRARREEWYTHRFLTRGELLADFRRLAELSIPEAVRWWSRVKDESDLPAAFEERRSRPVVGIPFESYVQEYLAYSFVLARFGDPRAGEALQTLATTLELPEQTRRKLEDLAGGKSGLTNSGASAAVTE